MSDQAYLPFVPRQSRVERRFAEWLRTDDGQKVLCEVTRRARELQARGFRHYGLKAIFESIRYDAAVGLVGDGNWKLNNSYTAHLARAVMALCPDLLGFFELRELRGRF